MSNENEEKKVPEFYIWDGEVKGKASMTVFLDYEYSLDDGADYVYGLSQCESKEEYEQILEDNIHEFVSAKLSEHLEELYNSHLEITGTHNCCTEDAEISNLEIVSEEDE